MIFWYDLHEAKAAWLKYRSYVNKNSIFLRPELSHTFENINKLMWDTLVSREIGQEANDTKMWVEASKKMQTEIEPLLNELRREVRAILRDHSEVL